MQRSVPLTLAALALLATCAGIALAQTTITTYRWVDAQGVVHYSDTPQPGAQVIQLQSAQTYHASPAPPTPPAAKTATTTTDPNSPYQSCGIVQPATEASYFAPESVPVAVQLTPGLRPGDELAVTVDGAALQPVAPGRYQVQAPERGAHTVNLDIHDPDGKQVCRASPVTFYVQQPSLLSPTSPARGH
jgi:hypothetical protein